MGDGKGTPWGPMENAKPNAPEYEAYDTNTQHFMDSPEARDAIAQMATQGGDAQRNYLAGATKALGTGTTSGSMQGRLANISALAEKNKNSALTDIAGKQMDAYNRAKEAANRQKQAQYGMDSQAYGHEQESRGNAIGSLVSAPLSLLGSFLGRK